jgi:hypothetical protein
MSIPAWPCSPRRGSLWIYFQPWRKPERARGKVTTPSHTSNAPLHTPKARWNGRAIGIIFSPVRFPVTHDPAHSRLTSLPASYAKLLLVDRETKNAVASFASFFVAVLLVAQSANPAPEANRIKRLLPSAGSSTATAATIHAPSSVPLTTWSTLAKPLELTPAATAPVLAAPFQFRGTGSDREHAVDCLAAAAWYEAGNDPESQRSVIQVVLNRVRHPSFPSTVCGVVFQGSERTTGCQFTFTCDGSMQRRFPSAKQWRSARVLSEKALAGSVDADVGQATHYHADYVSPWWSSALQKVNQIGAHIFYRWPGGRGHFARNRNLGTEADALAAANVADVAAGPGPAGTPGMLVSTTVKTASDAPLATISPNVSRAHLLAIDPQSPSGRWAVSALDQCSGQASCSVMAYGQGSELERNANLEPDQMERPLFLFVRDPASGMEVALWDCDRVSRPKAEQCQPRDRGALLRLMRNR